MHLRRNARGVQIGDAMIGKQLAHYRITALLGKGGMGEVYRATDTRLGRDVALKVLPREFSADTERLARFQREARTLAALQHPHVASIYGLETAGDQTFLVMELVEGEDLSARLARGALELDKALEIAEQITSGMDAAHEKGIVHRDLKPANIKLGSDGTVKILDFGLARAMAGDPGPEQELSASPTLTAMMTSPGVILGTAAYMSPEQARGRALDRRSDIFSFGVILYEMLTGVCPFRGDSVSDIIASILKEQADPDALPGSTPPAIRLLIHRCLEKDPRRRLRDIGEARLIIESVRTGDTTASTILGLAPPWEDASMRPPARFRRRELGAWALAAILLGALGWALFGRQEAAPAATRTYRLAVPIDDENALGHSEGGLSISPDGSRIAYLNKGRLFLRRLDSWESIEITGTAGACNPFWSPDGQWLAFGLGKDLFRIRADGTQRKLITTTESELDRTSGGAWLSDDRIVFRGRKDLYVVAAGGGNPAVFVAAADSGYVDFHEPEALPDGQGFLVSIHEQEGINALGHVGLDGRLEVLMTIPGANLADVCYSPTGHILFLNHGDLFGLAFSPTTRTTAGDPFPIARNASVPSVSGDGTLAYIRGTGTILRQFVLVDRAGKITGRLGQPDGLLSIGALSPDATWAAGSNEADDMYMHDDRLARTLISASGEEHDMMSISADGGTVYFGTGTENAYRIGSKAVGRNEPEKTIVPAGEMGAHFYAACPVVTQDGKTLFYTTIGANKKQDIAWLELGGDGRPQRFLSSDAEEFAARPSPADPRYVAYVSDESGKHQVYLTTWPDGDQKQAVSIDGGYWPRWKSDGTELYFARDNDIYAATVSYDPLRIATPVKLFSRPDPDDRQPFGWPAVFDASVDGRLFLVTEVVQDQNADPTIAIVPRWSPALD